MILPMCEQWRCQKAIPLSFVFSLLALAIPFSAQADANDHPSLKMLTREEMEFLLKNCPDMTRRVSHGTVVVHGEIIEAPMLVTIDKDQIKINATQVVPAQQRDKDFAADKIADKVQTQLYLEGQGAASASEASVERHLREQKSLGGIDDFQIIHGRNDFPVATIRLNSETSRIHSALLPPSIKKKHWLLVVTVLQEFATKKESLPRDDAQQWLRSRLDDLKALRIISLFEFESADMVDITFPKDYAPMHYYIGNEKSPGAVAYMERWKSARVETRAKADQIVSQLNQGGILIYSFAFEKAVPRNAALLSALKSIQENRDMKRNGRFVREALSLTDEQTKALVEELR